MAKKLQSTDTPTDDMTGLVLRLEIKDEYHQTGFYLSALWGTKLCIPEFAVQLIS